MMVRIFPSGKGTVKLGHETKVVYEVHGIPSDISSVWVENKVFKDIPRNQSALILLKEGFRKEHFVLNNANDHTLALQVQGNAFVERSQQKADLSSPYIIWIVIAALGLGFLAQKLILGKKKALEIVR